MSKTKKILVIVESTKNNIKPFAFECVHAARSLADSLEGTIVDALCFDIDQSITDCLVHWGADNVRNFPEPSFKRNYFGASAFSYRTLHKHV